MAENLVRDVGMSIQKLLTSSPSTELQKLCLNAHDHELKVARLTARVAREEKFLSFLLQNEWAFLFDHGRFWLKAGAVMS